MPSLYIMSLFEKRKRQYGGQIRKVRQDLVRFLDTFESQAGKEAASVVRAYAAVPRKYFLDDDEGEGLADDQDAFLKVRQLAIREVRLLRKMRSPDCFFQDRRKPPYVLLSYGISWDDVELLVEGDKLPLEHILRLLDVVRNGKASTEALGWGRAFRRQRRRLVRLLRTAASLEEEVACRFEGKTTLDLNEWLKRQPNHENDTQ
jgi:hypothetical protein